MKEILSIHVGQAGCQIGNAIWELYAAEHSIDNCGLPINNLDCEEEVNNSSEVFFELMTSGKYVPRSIFIDTEPTVIDEINCGGFKTLFDPNNLLSGLEDSANIFSRGYFYQGSLMATTFDKAVNSLFEHCESPYALMIFRSYSGGTGSGLTSTLLEIISENFPKMNKVEISLLPKVKQRGANDPVISSYNSILSLHYTMDDFDSSIFADNDALVDILKTNLYFKHSSFSPVNRFLAQACSNLTSSARFEASLYNDFLFMQTNLIPYPRLHFPLLHYAPCTTAYHENFEINLVNRITLDVYNSKSKVLSVDQLNGKFISCCLNFRGSVSPIDVYSSLNSLKLSNLKFVDWCPTSFKVGITNKPLVCVPGSQLFPTECNLTMIANSSAISEAFLRLGFSFKRLYSKRAFVHWFVGDGLEEIEFENAFLNVSSIAQDYAEIEKDTD